MCQLTFAIEFWTKLFVHRMGLLVVVQVMSIVSLGRDALRAAHWLHVVAVVVIIVGGLSSRHVVGVDTRSCCVRGLEEAQRY